VKIIVCPDKFKGSLSASEVCSAITDGILRADANADVQSYPMADGGEGTCALLTELHHGSFIQIKVKGPLFTPVLARYGISGNGEAAFIEMAEASGLTLLTPGERNPLLTTTFGTGELIADAIRRKVELIVLGLGGSATNDAGIGMAAALGYSFRDVTGELLQPIGENLIHIHHVGLQDVNPGLKDISVVALCDVTNPLFGPEGAAFVYGPQKGGNEKQLQLLDAGLRNFGRIMRKRFNTSVDFPGAGAAGGLGAGAKVFLRASMRQGVKYMIESGDLAAKIRDADLVITGEGKIDEQTFSGKVVSAVLNLASAEGKPVVAVCGQSDIPPETIRSKGIQTLVTLVDEITTEESAVENARRHLTEKIASLFDAKQNGNFSYCLCILSYLIFT